ncbi:MAG TPA: hypothetical protein VHZ81_14350 [Galbitalea sp.]|nr:hypothetical protein [Galbitalea sp.]
MTTGSARLAVRYALSLIAVAAVAVGLVACAPAKVSGGHSGAGSHIGSHPGSTTSTAASPTPTPTPLAAPAIRITRTCGALVSTSTLTASLGVAAPAVAPPPSFDEDIIFQQDGALRCNWSNNYAKDATQTSSHLEVWVLPDVSATNWTDVAKTLVEFGETKTTLIGGDAYGWCTSALPKGTVCNIDTRVGTTWISFELESVPRPFTTSAAGLTHFAALLNPIVTAAGTSGFVTEPRWSDPEATATPATCAATLPDSEVQTAASVSGVSSIGPDLDDQESLGIYVGAGMEMGRVECDLASSDQQSGFFATVLPGGAWAWSQLQVADSSLPGHAPVPSLGTQAIEYSDSASDTVQIDWVRGHNLCSVNVSLPTHSKQASVALALATYINTKIPG